MTTRSDIIRELARQRMLLVNAPSFVLEELKTAPDEILAGLPEGTLMTCAESLVALMAQGLSLRAAFDTIELHRSQFVPGKDLPEPLDLASYVRYRYELENPGGPQIPPAFLTDAADYALKAAKQAYRA
jgi:hypothetical protein